MVKEALQIAIGIPGRPRIAAGTITTGVRDMAVIEIGIVSGIGIIAIVTGIAIDIEIGTGTGIEIEIATRTGIETGGTMEGIETMEIGSGDRDAMMILLREGGDRQEAVTVIKSQSWGLLYGNGHGYGTYWETLTCTIPVNFVKS
jgi:hypothetical protein